MARNPVTRYARNVDGVSIAYQIVGTGPLDVVLVPGFVSNVDFYWENPAWAKILSRIAEFSRLILWDKRGTGLSDPVARVPTLDERVDDLMAVMDAAEVDRAALFGVSEGGPMALLFAAAHPQRVSALALYGTSPKFAASDDWPWGWKRDEIVAWFDEVEHKWGQGALLSLFAPSQVDHPRALDLVGARNSVLPASWGWWLVGSLTFSDTVGSCCGSRARARSLACALGSGARRRLDHGHGDLDARSRLFRRPGIR